MEPVRIFLDVDESLLASHRVYDWEQSLLKAPNAKPFTNRNDQWVTFLRPGAHELIAGCQEIAPTAVLTSGDKIFQEGVLRLHGITSLPVFGRDEMRELPKSQLSILVDDLEIPMSGMQSKMEALCPDMPRGEFNRIEPDPKRFVLVRVTPWIGPNRHSSKDPWQDTGLSKALATVRELVRLAPRVAMDIE
jgi:hypothetical protein